jgi:hypothetical protein
MSPKGKTLLIQSSHNNGNIIRVPPTIKWSDINLRKEWYLMNETHPVNVQNNQINLDYAQHYLDGTVKKN